MTTIRIYDDNAEKLEQLALSQGVGVWDIIEELLEEYLAEHGGN